MIAQYVLDSGRSNYSLTAIANEYLHFTVKDETEFQEANGQMDMFDDNSQAYMDYGFDICTAVLNLVEVQQQRIKDEQLDDVFYSVELPLIEVMASMEYEGFKVDRGTLMDFGRELSQKIDEISARVFDMAGETFNLNSPFQLGDILFEKLGLPAGKKTKEIFSSADILERIKDKHPIVLAVLEYRTVSKLKSTYIDGLIPLINENDGKLHAHFNQTVTTTGRISCTEPNLQNIPVRQEMGRQLRKAFIPDSDNCVLVGADYSQIELRVLAHMSGDEALIDAFNRGEDIHRATAANVLGVPESEITIEERSRAKAVNFGVIYGMSSFGLSSELNITRKDAEEYIDTYFRKHTAVKAFMDGQVESCREKGYVTTIMGRKRYIKE
ncbi:MAG: DNA polymerase [Clostridia bacterium]